jgi:hypothetical protein
MEKLVRKICHGKQRNTFHKKADELPDKRSEY